MSVYEDDSIVVRPSPIEGLGAFAKRPLKKGEVVFRWNPRRLQNEDVERVSKAERRYLNTLEDGTTVLMQSPERYVNSSDDPNTMNVGETDVALRDIAQGEEITSKYSLETSE